MKNKYKYNSLKDLQDRQLALKSASNLQGNIIVQDAKSYVEDFSLANLFHKKAEPAIGVKLKQPDNNQLLSGKILSFALPLLLNKTIFKKSGIITKTAVGLISGKTGTKIGGYLINLLSGKRKKAISLK